jgi:hypothetical protein
VLAEDGAVTARTVRVMRQDWDDGVRYGRLLGA